MVDLEFLMTNYKAGKIESKPLLVMYGQMEGNPRDYPAVTCTKVSLPNYIARNSFYSIFLVQS